MLTLKMLNQMPPGTVFATGEIENSPEGLYMTDSFIGRTLIWAAKRGEINDWAIYAHWKEFGLQRCLDYGQKVTSKKNIVDLVECDSEALSRYRY